MPTISEFYGIHIQMYFDDKHSPHFHVIYAERRALIAISDCHVMAGSIPPRTYRLVRDWWKDHRAELEQNWDLARRHEKLHSIEGLE